MRLTKITIAIGSAVLISIGILIGKMTSEVNTKTESTSKMTKNAMDVETKKKSVEQVAKNDNSVTSSKKLEMATTEDKYVRPENETEDKLKISHKALLKTMGATKALEWQEKYDLGVYNPIYDQTWQDDMYNRAYELALGEDFSNDIEMTHIKCKEKNCNLEIRQLPSSKKGGSRLASEFLLALKDHPAILESGKKRNVYINTIQLVDGKHQVVANIH